MMKFDDRNLSACADSNAAKYVTSLCRHWAHRLDVELGDQRSVVRFQNAVATVTADGDQSVVTLLGNDRFTVERLQEVVRTHSAHLTGSRFRNQASNPSHFEQHDGIPLVQSAIYLNL
jgi:uncharacterized protein